MPEQRKIIWTKWSSLGGLITEERPPDDHEHDDKLMVVLTPGGILPVKKQVDAEKQFRFYVLHSNFDLSEEIEALLDEVPGVEIVDVETRYRARIGIGHCFVISQTQRAIEMELGAYTPPLVIGLRPPSDEQAEELGPVLRLVNEGADYWTVTVTEGDIAYTLYDDKRLYQEAVAALDDSDKSHLVLGSYAR